MRKRRHFDMLLNGFAVSKPKKWLLLLLGEGCVGGGAAFCCGLGPSSSDDGQRMPA
jgi:hypothetical protein